MNLMPEVTGVVETCLYVDDLERAARFYEDVCEFKRLIGDERFCALSVAGRNVLLLFRKGATLESIPTPGGAIPPHDGAGHTHTWRLRSRPPPKPTGSGGWTNGGSRLRARWTGRAAGAACISAIRTSICWN